MNPDSEKTMLSASHRRHASSSSTLFTSSSDEEIDHLSPMEASRIDAEAVDEFFSTIDVMAGAEGELNLLKFKFDDCLIDFDSPDRKTEELADEGCMDEVRWQKRFLEEDSPANVVLSEDSKSYLAITKEKLIAKLTSCADENMVDTFFLTYQRFSNAVEVARMIGVRLRGAFMNDLGESQKIKIMTFRLLKSWFDNYFDTIPAGQLDDVKASLSTSLDGIWADAPMLSLADKQLLINIGKLYHEDILTRDVLETESCCSSVRRAQTSWWNQLFTSKGNASDSYPPSYEILLLETSSNVAEQLCIFEKSIIDSVDWKDFLLLMGKTETPELTGLQKCIQHFNSVCRWFVEEICKKDQSVSYQTTKIKKLIKIAHKCFQACNYATTIQATLALQNHTVISLKEAWAQVPKAELKLFEELVSFASPLKNFKSIRMATEGLEKETGSSCVPFLGIFVSDLKSLAEAPYDHPSHMITWQKYEKAANIIKTVRELKNPKRNYPFERNEKLLRFLSAKCQQRIQEALFT